MIIGSQAGMVADPQELNDFRGLVDLT